MRQLTPTQKGAAAEAQVTAAVIQLGLTVLRPLCEGRRYDLIIDLEPELVRVQANGRVASTECCQFAYRPVGTHRTAT